MTNKLVVIDGNAILHRGYHAYPFLTGPGGEPINAVYGFFSMFLNILHDLQPSHIAICFDTSKPTIRQEMYAGYHQHRPSMTNDFAVQIPVVHELLRTMNVQIYGLAGYEGDDLVGTIAHQVTSSEKKVDDAEVIIVTGDRDLLQLVNPQTKVLMPITGVTKTMIFDEAKVKEKYGVTSQQFVDYKALIGDQSDGYPGVTGIGPKTAVSLLEKYGTFENLYAHVGELPEKVGLKLATDAEQAALAKKLARIITDAPIQFSLNECKVDDLHIAEVRAEFVSKRFNSLIKKLDDRYPSEVKSPKLKVKSEKKTSENQLGFFD